MTSDLDRLARADRAAVEARLGELVDALAGHHPGMREAVRYSLLGGGKRIRPLLCLWTHDALAGSARAACLDAACALECIHTYSLVHDDLPCMDNDDFRRGQPSSHRRFGEAVAVLAGDALLTLAFDVATSLSERHAVAPASSLAAASVLARAAGTDGLIGGQAMDLSPPSPRDAGVVDAIHARKTARLIAASLETGAILAGAGREVRERVHAAGMAAGRAFQIADDILDIEGAQETLGKTPGKDVHDGKLTLPSVVGMEASHARAREYMEAALAGLPGVEGGPLGTLIRHLVDRNR
jgi:geranylgeranyl diphosphate synthase type II